MLIKRCVCVCVCACVCLCVPVCACVCVWRILPQLVGKRGGGDSERNVTARECWGHARLKSEAHCRTAGMGHPGRECVAGQDQDACARSGRRCLATRWCLAAKRARDAWERQSRQACGQGGGQACQRAQRCGCRRGVYPRPRSWPGGRQGSESCCWWQRGQRGRLMGRRGTAGAKGAAQEQGSHPPVRGPRRPLGSTRLPGCGRFLVSSACSRSLRAARET